MVGGNQFRSIATGLGAALLCACATGGTPGVSHDDVGFIPDTSELDGQSDSVSFDGTSSDTTTSSDGTSSDGVADATDGGIDGADGSSDSATDTIGVDSGIDTGVDSGVDTGIDTGVDTGTDTGTPDTGTDTGTDTGSGGCTKPTDCGSGLKCTGPTICGSVVCYACGSSSGTTTGYGACTDSSTCASGVCDSLRKHCSASCASGTTGDTDCTTSMGSGFACSEVGFTIGTATGTLGMCAKKCLRNGDCTGTDVCQAANNDGFNRVDLTCGPPGTGAAMGTACTGGSTCSSRLCISSKCSAPCVTASDCSGGLTKCSAVLFSLPKGGTQLVNVCAP